MWVQLPDSLEARIKYFILSHIERPTGEKILKIKMEELAQAMNDTRMGVSKALNAMQENGLLELHRGEIVVKEAERLI